jgi:hypothetical protein
VVTDGDAGGTARVVVDGVEQPDQAIPLVDDRQEHAVEIRLAVAAAPNVRQRTETAGV